MVIQCLKMVIARSCYGLLSKIISSFTALIIFQSLLFSMQLKTEVTDGMTHNRRTTVLYASWLTLQLVSCKVHSSATVF